MLNIKVVSNYLRISRGHHSAAKKITRNITKRRNVLIIDDDTWLIAIGNNNK